MSQVTAQKIRELVSLHPDVVCFGSEADQVGDDWIKKAEQRLGLELPRSYKWFLKTYAGGEIGAEEIYSIYGVDFEGVNGGDIVYQHIVGIKNNSVDSKRLVISETDMGEVFFLDYSRFKDGECPVNLRLPSGESVNYASDFYEFLYKRILAHI
ncbi:SMI1/KNR4 family protein [Larsenimonas rhizosphaerae]|uniref:SMI1/KNR4 family protein n=1 Tax=Larsenimonas rhizosphaerae TaxID=2944682 RepID=UPI002033CFF2|nr:SMI1/KNR4 family protein [Larsenimonas rhizosphaerae]MCM2131783.1 SMI1/KNR4 family protein [Larsenimonas rhizosphaerae]